METQRSREASGGIRQCNEGKYDFHMSDEDGEGNCVLRVSVSKFLDTSLIDVDCHPTYISLIIKNKVSTSLTVN